jgi:DNA repair protein RadC
MVLDSIPVTHSFFKSRIDHSDVEVLWIAALDSNCTVLGHEMLFKGTANYCLFHPRDIFRFAIKFNSVSFIIAHNHPSGCPEPSSDDFFNTRRIFELSLLLQIQMLDHLIIAKDKHFSFRALGLFKNWEKRYMNQIKKNYFDGKGS